MNCRLPQKCPLTSPWVSLSLSDVFTKACSSCLFWQGDHVSFLTAPQGLGMKVKNAPSSRNIFSFTQKYPYFYVWSHGQNVEDDHALDGHIIVTSGDTSEDDSSPMKHDEVKRHLVFWTKKPEDSIRVLVELGYFENLKTYVRRIKDQTVLTTTERLHICFGSFKYLFQKFIFTSLFPAFLHLYIWTPVTDAEVQLRREKLSFPSVGRTQRVLLLWAKPLGFYHRAIDGRCWRGCLSFVFLSQQREAADVQRGGEGAEEEIWEQRESVWHRRKPLEHLVL